MSLDRSNTVFKKFPFIVRLLSGGCCHNGPAPVSSAAYVETTARSARGIGQMVFYSDGKGKSSLGKLNRRSFVVASVLPLCLALNVSVARLDCDCVPKPGCSSRWMSCIDKLRRRAA